MRHLKHKSNFADDFKRTQAMYIISSNNPSVKAKKYNNFSWFRRGITKGVYSLYNFSN